MDSLTIKQESMPLVDSLTDERLLKAVSDSVENQTMSPLIKEELRCSILNRRHAEGRGEISLDEPKPKQKMVLTDEEKRRKLRRREQNRRAATKCRNKKKEEEEQRVVSYQKEKEKNVELSLTVEQLRAELASLEKILNDHLETCCKNNSGCQVYETITPPHSVLPPSSPLQQGQLSITPPEQQGIADTPSGIFAQEVMSATATCETSMLSYEQYPVINLYAQQENVTAPTIVEQEHSAYHQHLSIPSPSPQNDQSLVSQTIVCDPQGLPATSPSFYAGTEFKFGTDIIRPDVKESTKASYTVTSDQLDLLEDENASVGSIQSWENFSFTDVTELLQSDGSFPILNSEDLNSLCNSK